MKSVIKSLLAGVLAVGAAASYAQTGQFTMTFEDLPVSSTVLSGPVPDPYMGFSFYYGGAVDIDAGMVGDGQWYASFAPQYAGSTTPSYQGNGSNVNLSGLGDSGISAPMPGEAPTLEPFAFSLASGGSFTFQSLHICCGPVFLELLPANGDPIIALGWNDPLRGIGSGFAPGVSTGVYSIPSWANNIPLDAVFVYSASTLFTADDITVTVPTTPVPEPSAYAMMALGLLALGAVARRQKRSSASV